MPRTCGSQFRPSHAHIFLINYSFKNQKGKRAELHHARSIATPAGAGLGRLNGDEGLVLPRDGGQTPENGWVVVAAVEKGQP